MLFIVAFASLSWLPVLGTRRILVVIGGGLVSSVVAGGTQKIAGCQGCFALRWCIACGGGGVVVGWGGGGGAAFCFVCVFIYMLDYFSVSPRRCAIGKRGPSSMASMHENIDEYRIVTHHLPRYPVLSVTSENHKNVGRYFTRIPWSRLQAITPTTLLQQLLLPPLLPSSLTTLVRL